MSSHSCPLRTEDRGTDCLKLCTCSGQSQAYCQVTFTNTVGRPQELKNSHAVASGRGPGLQTSPGRSYHTGHSVVKLPPSLFVRLLLLKSSPILRPPPPVHPSPSSSSAYSSMCQSCRYLETAFAFLSVFSFPDQALPCPSSQCRASSGPQGSPRALGFQPF